MKRLLLLVAGFIILLSPCVFGFDEYTTIKGEDFFNDTVKNIASGELSLMPQDILESIIDTFMSEIRNSKSLILSIFLIALVSGVINSASSEEKVSDVAFFVCFCLMTIAVTKIITVTVGYGTDVINEMSTFVTKLAPMLSVLLVTSGYSVSAASFYPVFSASVYLICLIAQRCIIPLIYSSCVLGILNNMSGKIHLNNFNRLIKSVTKWILTGSLTIFTGINAIYGFCTPAVDSFAMKAAKFAVGSMVPVVGGFVADSIETVIGGARLVKNSVGTAGIIVVLVTCFIPLVKVGVIMAVLKISSALVEPIGDKRYSDMLMEASDAITAVFAMMITVSILFIISIAIIIGVT